MSFQSQLQAQSARAHKRNPRFKKLLALCAKVAQAGAFSVMVDVQLIDDMDKEALVSEGILVNYLTQSQCYVLCWKSRAGDPWYTPKNTTPVQVKAEVEVDSVPFD